MFYVVGVKSGFSKVEDSNIEVAILDTTDGVVEWVDSKWIDTYARDVEILGVEKEELGTRFYYPLSDTPSKGAFAAKYRLFNNLPLRLNNDMGLEMLYLNTYNISLRLSDICKSVLSHSLYAEGASGTIYLSDDLDIEDGAFSELWYSQNLKLENRIRLDITGMQDMDKCSNLITDVSKSFGLFTGFTKEHMQICSNEIALYMMFRWDSFDRNARFKLTESQDDFVVMNVLDIMLHALPTISKENHAITIFSNEIDSCIKTYGSFLELFGRCIRDRQSLMDLRMKILSNATFAVAELNYNYIKTRAFLNVLLMYLLCGGRSVEVKGYLRSFCVEILRAFDWLVNNVLNGGVVNTTKCRQSLEKYAKFYRA